MRRRRDYRKLRLVGLALFLAVFVFTLLSQSNTSVKVEAVDLDNFDAGYVISDYQMKNYNSMTEAEIQAFLTSVNSCPNTSYEYYQQLSAANPGVSWHFKDGHFVCLSEELFGDGMTIGTGETAAHIIWQAAQDYKINPQVLMTILQKEQSLVTDPIPNSFDYKVAMGYGCFDTGPWAEQFFGLKNQIRGAAEMLNAVVYYGSTNFPVGENYVRLSVNTDCGTALVNIRNLATSALYRYTPYAPLGSGSCYSGDKVRFYTIFEDWFGGATVSKVISAPRNIKATKDGDSIIISWDEPSDAILYNNIRYDVVLAGKDKQEFKASVDGDKREYIFKDLSDGVYYASSVRAVANGGAIYDRIVFEIAIGSEPNAPTGVAAKMKNGGIEISWNEAENEILPIIKYEVVLADVDKKEFKKEVDASATSTIFYGLALNEYFAASVRAVNAVGGRHSRITFLIKNYEDLSDYSEEPYAGFSDMPTDEISKTAVSWAALNGITDKNERFNGEVALTRRQAMVLLWRFYKDIILVR